MNSPILYVELPTGPERIELDKFPFRLGRGDDNDYRFGDSAIGVSACHAQILQRDGRLFIEDTNSTNGTLVDGKRIDGPTEITTRSVIGLGRKGPRMRVLGADQQPAGTIVDSIDSVDGAEAPTGPGEVGASGQKQGVGLNTLVRYVDQARSVERRRVTRVVGGSGVLALLLTIGLFWWLRGDSGDVAWIDAYRDRVWMVCTRTDLDGRTSYNAQGTAWSYRPGQLATNSHVADLLAGLRRDQRLVARAVRGGNVVEVGISAVTKHPAYDLFGKAWSTYPPWLDKHVAHPVGQFDVALLTIRDEDRAAQGEPLPVATADQSAKVRQGQELHYLGYPSENKNANPERPDLHYLTGKCTKLSDAWWAPASRFDVEGIVSVQFPGAGGASGGPLFDRSGRVIGLLAAGDVTSSGAGGRSSEGIIHGANVALLREVDGSTVPRERRREIEEGMRALYRKGIDGKLIVEDVTAGFKKAFDEAGVTLVRESGRDTMVETTLRAGEHYDFSVHLPNGVASALVVAVPKDEPLPLRLLSASEGDKVIGEHEVPYAPVLWVKPNGPRPRQLCLVAGKDAPVASAEVRIYIRSFALTKK